MYNLRNNLQFFIIDIERIKELIIVYNEMFMAYDEYSDTLIKA